MKYRATFDTAASITVDVDVPGDVIEAHTRDGEVDEFAIEEWAANRAHAIASEDIETWGVTTRARLDLSIDGIGAEPVERIEEGQ